MKPVIFQFALVLGLAVGFCALPDDGAAKNCPPGLAKKHNGCMPPGLAKKRHGADHDDHNRDQARYYNRVLRPGEYILIPREDWDRYGLYDPRDGTGYAIYDNEIFRVALDTMRVIDAIRTLTEVLN